MNYIGPLVACRAVTNTCWRKNIYPRRYVLKSNWHIMWLDNYTMQWGHLQLSGQQHELVWIENPTWWSMSKRHTSLPHHPECSNIGEHGYNNITYLSRTIDPSEDAMVQGWNGTRMQHQIWLSILLSWLFRWLNLVWELHTHSPCL